MQPWRAWRGNIPPREAQPFDATPSRTVDFVDRRPKALTGKILKRDLREPYWSAAAPRKSAFIPDLSASVVDCDPDALEIGPPVRVTFEPSGFERAVSQFQPQA